jgi:ABC-type enterochelin transport system permease subunit
MFNLQRLTQRKFVAPTTATALALVNDGAALGLDFKTIVFVGCMSIAYAVMEQWGDVTRIKATGGK